MRVLVAMSGGVDSSAAAALLLEQGHDVVGATMKLWGGESDTGCCSVADVEDARRVARQLGVTHHIFNFSEQFEDSVVTPYVAGHQAGRTPNPCVECNRHLKFDRFLHRGRQLGFDAMATGHHARVVDAGGRWELRRGRDEAKDQSYVLYMLRQEELGRLLLPVGELTKADVRERAARLGLRTAAKPDSQDVCFISRTGGGRQAFLGSRIPLRPGVVVDSSESVVGSVPAVELVTVGQRRHLGSGPRTRADRRYALSVDVGKGRVTIGPLDELLTDRVELEEVSWVDIQPSTGLAVEVQTSAHATPVPGRWRGQGRVILERPVRRVAAGQSVVLYDGQRVLGGGVAAAR